MTGKSKTVYLYIGPKIMNGQLKGGGLDMGIIASGGVFNVLNDDARFGVRSSLNL